MKVYGLSAHDVIGIVDDVSERLYDGNLKVSRYNDKTHLHSVPKCSFTLGTKDESSMGVGYRFVGSSEIVPSDNACWHAHYDVLDAMFLKDPKIEVETMRAVYRITTFDNVSYSSAFEVRGSIGNTLYYAPDMCACGLNAWPFEGRRPGQGGEEFGR